MNTTQVWFTSDHHFGHKNIIEYSKRPFADVQEMDAEMIKRWNEKVGNNDHVFHLGDFALCSTNKLREIRQQLNGKIHLINGNHESAAQDCPDCFEWIKDYYELTLADADASRGQRHLVLFHYAMRVWNASHYGAWHLYGHSHASLPDDDKALSFDIGVDCHDFYPLSYAEVKTIMDKKNWTPPFGLRN